MLELRNLVKWEFSLSNMKSQFSLLFDLGNVLLPIDLSLTYEAFSSLSTMFNAEEIKEKIFQENLWLGYESGQLSDTEFYNFLSDRLALNCSQEEFNKAFTALLLEFPSNIYAFLEQLTAKFDLYLLSNTSVLHSRIFLNNKLGPSGENLFDLFKKVYFSYEIGITKPNPMIYKQLLHDSELNVDDVIFFDDNFDNVESARKLGIDSVLIDPPISFSQISLKIMSLC